jgi:fluoroquinolone transport system ATP-binding protein
MFQVKDLKFKYPKNKEDTLKGFSFSIAQGEIFGFLGPSGAGKSTTQKILVKLLENYEGEIFYDGKSLKNFSNQFYEEIGVCFEMPISFSKLTAMENLAFFQKLYRNNVDVEPLLKRVGLYEDKDKLVGEYSKGMKIRLNMVRALLNNPRMLFLDEPTNGLDPTNAKIIKELIKEFRNDGGTVFLTSHIMADVDELCDRVAFITEGRINEMDSPRNLKLKYGKKTVTVEYQENSHLIKEQFTMDEIKQQSFIDLIRSKNIETIHSGETTLEEIFIHVTGERLTHET